MTSPEIGLVVRRIWEDLQPNIGIQEVNKYMADALYEKKKTFALAVYFLLHTPY